MNQSNYEIMSFKKMNQFKKYDPINKSIKNKRPVKNSYYF